jgi:hypothetical protein
VVVIEEIGSPGMAVCCEETVGEETVARGGEIRDGETGTIGKDVAEPATETAVTGETARLGDESEQNSSANQSDLAGVAEAGSAADAGLESVLTPPALEPAVDNKAVMPASNEEPAEEPDEKLTESQESGTAAEPEAEMPAGKAAEETALGDEEPAPSEPEGSAEPVDPAMPEAPAAPVDPEPAPTEPPAPEPEPADGNFFDSLDDASGEAAGVEEAVADDSEEAAVSGDPFESPPAGAEAPMTDPFLPSEEAGPPLAGETAEEATEAPVDEPADEPAADPFGDAPAEPMLDEPGEADDERPVDAAAEPADGADAEESPVEEPVAPATGEDDFLVQEPSRRWIDASGTISLVGRLIEISPDGRCLMESGGRRWLIPLTRLSEHDRAYVRQAEGRLAKRRSGGAGQTVESAEPPPTTATAGL